MNEAQATVRKAIESSLAGEGPASGFELLQRADTTAEFEAALYPALHRLEAMGRVSARWEETASGPRRRYRRRIGRLRERLES